MRRIRLTARRVVNRIDVGIAALVERTRQGIAALLRRAANRIDVADPIWDAKTRVVVIGPDHEQGESR